FHDVLLQHEATEPDSWRIARAPPGIVLDDLVARQAALAASLQESFRTADGTGRFCAVNACRLDEAYCFGAHLADRLQLFDVFTEAGQHRTQAARPCLPILFMYHGSDGRIWLNARQRAADRILDLVQRFGRTALGVDLDGSCLAPAFRLDLF